MCVSRSSGTIALHGDHHLDRARGLVTRRLERVADRIEREAVRDEPARDLRPLPAKQLERDVEIGPCPAAAVDEGANHPQLLGEDEERRERGRAGEGAEQADGPARTRGCDGGVERVGLAADRLDDEVDRCLQRVAEETGCLAFAHHAVGPERQRRLALLRPAGDDEDLARPARAGRDDRHEADRARAEHEHAVADREAGQSDGVHRDAERLRQRRGREVDTRRHRKAVTGRHLDVLGEPAGDRHSDDADGRAALVVTAQAVAAAPAGGDALERHPVAGPEARHARADLRHLARDLVTWTVDGQYHLSVIPVQVRATDAALAHAHDDLAGAGGRGRNLLDGERTRRAAEGGAHQRRGPRRETCTSARFSRARPLRRKQRAAEEWPSADSKKATTTAWASACWRDACIGAFEGRGSWHGRPRWPTSMPICAPWNSLSIWNCAKRSAVNTRSMSAQPVAS